MNIFDFDGTIYNGDSTVDFFFWSLRRHPGLVRYLPSQIGGFLRYFLKRSTKTQAKENFYQFLQGIDAKKEVPLFWESHRKNIFPWYLERKAPTDIIISASPEFLLSPICEQLGVAKLLASRVDPETGHYDGINCHGAEKVRRLYDACRIRACDEFYTDSKADYPLARIADRAYMIRRGVPKPFTPPEA